VNQDAAVALELGDGVEVAAVADGMGGHAAGEVASREALEAVVEALRGGASLVEAVEAANRAVYRRAASSPEWHGMGTTLLVLLRRGRHYEIANVGDSRAYRIEGGTARRITRDHSFVAEAMAAGELTEEEAARSPWRNALTRAVGTDPSVEIDLFGPFDTERPHTVLLCTDGCYRWVEEAELAARLSAAPTPREGAAALGEAALAGGSDDNVTALVIKFGATAAVRADPSPRPSALAPPPMVPALGKRRARLRPRGAGREWLALLLIVLALAAYLIALVTLSH
jgi:serine/threonine protein phosphatase PrpC